MINPNLADVRFASAGTITHYRDDGSTGTYTVAAGDPLLQHRFSLAKLAWLTYKGPSADITPTTDPLYNANGTDAAILACFGLTWDATNRQWNYTAEDTSSGTIKTLSAVATEGRGAELLRDAQGWHRRRFAWTASANGTQNNYFVDSNGNPGSVPILEGSSDLQILRIGANIIDCADTDNFPTTITLNVGGTVIPVYGVEDLPYLYRMNFARVTQVEVLNATTSQLDWATLFLMPQLFNPHRSGVANTASPGKIRVNIYSGSVSQVYNVRADLKANAPLARWNLNQDLTADPAIIIPSSSFESFRSAIKTPNGSDASSPTTLSTLLTPPATIDPSMTSLHAFLYYVYTNLPETYSHTTTPAQINFRSFVNSLVMTLDYEYPPGSNVYYSYDTLSGNKAFTALGTGVGNDNITSQGPTLEFLPTTTDPTSGVLLNDLSQQANGNRFPSYHGLSKFDPRTTRFGVSDGEGFGTNAYPYNASNIGTSRGLRFDLPFANPGSLTIFPETWVQGNKSGWNSANLATTSNVADKDGIVRPADEWLSSSTSNNLFANLTVTNGSNRPVILQRPFKSVAELGYVFRDTPWKTLNFFDETSGDAALLDLFAVSDEPTVSQGRVNLNGTAASLQQSLLSGVAQSYDGTSTLSSPSTVATAFNSYAFSSGAPTANMPFNVAGLAAFMDSTSLTNAYTPTSTPDKQQRESVVRALAGNTQTRTWNLLVDVVAQTGHYPSTAGSLNDFLVDGEKRYWLFVAIDRYTGKIVDRQLEPVDE